MTRETVREMLSEFLGTFILIVFGTAVVAQVVLSGQANGSYLSINLGWGIAVTMGVYVAGGVSGAHLNPAVTVALAVLRGFPWSKVIPYSIAQLAGAFTGALVTFITYREAFDRFDSGVRQVVVVVEPDETPPQRVRGQHSDVAGTVRHRPEPASQV